jgi:excinuclease UvrABC nuclease subunit
MSYVPPRYIVYRLFRRTDGVLIYVGSTGRWGRRMSQHEREQWWWPQVGDMKLQDCASEREALVIEDIAIKREKPQYNKRVNFAERKAAIAADEDAYMAARRWCS